ncbi:MAG TPA: NADP-binding protein [Pseudoalteromonas prydzensis]|uniref:NADP-binding protein n=1 Tax=Pseudoalteromonas prydzensis TaxID=182141 RepID=A0A7V1CYB8_9GAMM|nr:NADP-binding protein [Pseudoalteromonas prydzensis]HEA16562.1 NADP-binding protein [Pseudoalteromonas prydzensis]
MGTDKDQLVVLGAGWLGQPLCLQQQAKGWHVQGTHRSNVHQHAFQRQLVFADNKLTHQLDLHNAWWVCAIPPRSRHADSHYLATLTQAIELANSMQAKGFLLCSSTAVYDQDNATYTEQSAIQATTARQQPLIAAEQHVLDAGGKVLRLGGLIGPNREPGRFVAGKELRGSSMQTVNMVQQQDVINAVLTVLENWQTAAPIYNVVNPAHPTKADYYQQKCQQYGTQAPTFSSHSSAERIIDGSAIEELGFSYQFDI